MSRFRFDPDRLHRKQYFRPGVHHFGTHISAVTMNPVTHIPAPINDLCGPHVQMNPPGCGARIPMSSSGNAAHSKKFS